MTPVPWISDLLLTLAGAASREEESGSFLVAPGAGLIIWTVVLVVLAALAIAIIVALVRRCKRSAGPRAPRRG